MPKKSTFQLEGEFLGLLGLEGDKPKYMRLRTANGDLTIKISKELRVDVARFSLGDRLRCEGKQKGIKLKASLIEKVDRLEQVSQISEEISSNKKVKILVCQNSHCLHKGGKEIYAALLQQIDRQGFKDDVKVKPSGCLNYCKQAPCLMLLPDKSVYRNVRAEQIPVIISKIEHQIANAHASQLPTQAIAVSI